MKTKSVNFCNFTTLLSLFLILYISITTYIAYFDDRQKEINSDFFLMKTILLALFFIVMTLIFTFLKIYKKSYIQKQINERTKDILSENETLKTYAHIDTLTQCLNEKYFQERFDEEFKRAMREKQNISLIIVNIDEFKAFNDIYGRAEGDECLKIVANILVNHCNRPSDLVARCNGDEFFILLPNTKEPKTISNKCIDSVKALHIPHENSIASNVLTITIGVSSILPTNLSEKNMLLENAKESLLSAKRSGRNRVH